MAIAGLPVVAQPRQNPAEHGGAEVGHRALGQQQEAHVVHDQREAAPALLVAPADPLLARAQVLRGGREAQHRDPLALRVAHRAVHLLSHRLHAAQIMMHAQQALRALALFGHVEHVHLHGAQQNRRFFRQRSRFSRQRCRMHRPRAKKSLGKMSRKIAQPPLTTIT